MFLLHRPSKSASERFRTARARAPFSYAEVGATRALPAAAAPAGYRLDHNRIRLGEGEATFARAVAAVQGWRMFDLGCIRDSLRAMAAACGAGEEAAGRG